MCVCVCAYEYSSHLPLSLPTHLNPALPPLPLDPAHQAASPTISCNCYKVKLCPTSEENQMGSARPKKPPQCSLPVLPPTHPPLESHWERREGPEYEGGGWTLDHSILPGTCGRPESRSRPGRGSPVFTWRQGQREQRCGARVTSSSLKSQFNSGAHVRSTSASLTLVLTSGNDFSFQPIRRFSPELSFTLYWNLN